MHWSKIPTYILISGTSDQIILAVVKYQLLWANLEREPSPETLKRYLKNKELAIVAEYRDSIEKIVARDIENVKKKRGCDQDYYWKTKDKHIIPLYEQTEQIRSEKDNSKPEHITPDEPIQNNTLLDDRTENQRPDQTEDPNDSDDFRKWNIPY